MGLSYQAKGPGEYSPAEIDELVRLGNEHHWVQSHLSQDIADAGASRIIVKGEGSYIWDIEGRQYLDAMAGLYLANIGYGRREVIEALQEQLALLPYANSGAYSNVPAILLAEHIAKKAPGSLSRVFFCGGGSEAVEIALKMARQYHVENGEPRRTKFVSRRGQYHGSSWAAMGVGGKAQYRGAFDPMLPGVVQLDPPYWYRSPFPEGQASLTDHCVRQLENAIEHEGADTIAAFIATPMSGGNYAPPPDYWPRMTEVLRKHGILLIADEVICGFGRLGRWFGMEHWGVEADIMTIAKALTSGYVPSGAVVASSEVADRFRDDDRDKFMHGVTYGSHPGVMAAGLAVQRVIEEEGLVGRSAEMGGYLYRRLYELGDRHPSLGFVGGGWGMLYNLEMVKNRRTKEKNSGGERNSPYHQAFTAHLRDHGIATRGGDQITLSPPLTLRYDEADRLVEALDAVIGLMEKEYPVEEPFNEPVPHYPYLPEQVMAEGSAAR